MCRYIYLCESLLFSSGGWHQARMLQDRKHWRNDGQYPGIEAAQTWMVSALKKTAINSVLK